MIKQIEAENAINAFEDYKNNILLLFGEKDKLTQNVNNHLTSKDLISRNNVDYVIVKNADHLFNKAAYVDEVFDTTINWVIYNFGEKSEKRN